MKKIVVAVLGVATAFVLVNSGSAEAGHCRTGYGYGANYGAYLGVGVVAPTFPVATPNYGAFYGGGRNRCAPPPRCAVPVAPCVAPPPPCVTPAYYPPRGCAPVNVVTPGCRPCGFGF